MSSSSGNSSILSHGAWERGTQVRNILWRDYRTTGKAINPPGAWIYRLEQQVADPEYDPPPPSIKYFENRDWQKTNYIETFNTSADIETYKFNRNMIAAQSRYEDIMTLFQQPRFVTQRLLGFGGNGLTAHLRDLGPNGSDTPGSDIVTKVSLASWQSDLLKVKGSAHCVQIIDPEDIGMPPEEEVTLRLKDYDSSIDGDSSGNESLDIKEVRRRHRVPKRKDLTDADKLAKRQKKEQREEEIEREIRNQRKKKTRRDYIVMEYLQHGSLGSLITKLHSCKPDDDRLRRIPNQVLWGFWLCLIRACIAMEYPPRKFHPNRKRPERPEPAVVPAEGAVALAMARANGMVRELRGLLIQLVGPSDSQQTFEERLSRYTQLEGNLNERVPRTKGRLERTQNMIHADLDPGNILINGFEFDPRQFDQEEVDLEEVEPEGVDLEEIDPLENGQGGGSTNGSSSGPTNTDFAGPGPGNTARRPDRARREHVLVPRLKESFGPEWEEVEADMDGDQLANSRTCGYYSNKTNIWGIALSMWQLITKYEPPQPPAPQPPYAEVDRYPAYNMHGQTDLDDIFLDPKYANFKISYCPLLQDPRVDQYNWVDERLRKTIFRCMYHRPDDRPTLAELQREAERALRTGFPDETDDYIREWMQYWFFDAQASQPSPPSSPGSPGSPGSPSSPSPPRNPEPPGAPGAPGPSGTSDVAPSAPIIPGAELQAPQSEGDLHRLQLTIQFNAEFPNGHVRVPNQANELRCGLVAIIDSLQHQLGLNPVVDGVQINIGSFPTVEELLGIHKHLIDTGPFAALSNYKRLLEQGNMTVDTIGAILIEWGRRHNIQVHLGCILPDEKVYVISSPFEHAKRIWIYNDNAVEIAIREGVQMGNVRVFNHYEGLRRKSPPAEDDLPDFEDVDNGDF
ncbi:hypothetical protein F5Y10DRAFT_286997 [Nemania abortiva]|nr:hypothetical protein F5Y10DRAFT_286997 [Nemania abortiva]